MYSSTFIQAFLILSGYVILSRSVSPIERNTIAILAEQVLVSLSGYLKNCDYFPSKDLNCVPTNFHFGNSKNNVTVIVWNPEGEMIEMLSDDNYQSRVIHKSDDLVFLLHDFAESACSAKMRKFVRESYNKKPKSTIMSLDFSSIVS